MTNPDMTQPDPASPEAARADAPSWHKLVEQFCKQHGEPDPAGEGFMLLGAFANWLSDHSFALSVLARPAPADPTEAARAARRAYYAPLDAVNLIPWESLSTEVQEHWQSIADAVVAAYHNPALRASVPARGRVVELEPLVERWQRAHREVDDAYKTWEGNQWSVETQSRLEEATAEIKAAEEALAAAPRPPSSEERWRNPISARQGADGELPSPDEEVVTRRRCPP